MLARIEVYFWELLVLIVLAVSNVSTCQYEVPWDQDSCSKLKESAWMDCQNNSEMFVREIHHFLFIDDINFSRATSNFIFKPIMILEYLPYIKFCCDRTLCFSFLECLLAFCYLFLLLFAITGTHSVFFFKNNYKSINTYLGTNTKLDLKVTQYHYQFRWTFYPPWWISKPFLRLQWGLLIYNICWTILLDVEEWDTFILSFRANFQSC